MTRMGILELLLGKEIDDRLNFIPNSAERSFLNPEITHFELVEDEEIKKKYTSIVHDDYLIFKCWSGRTSAIECTNIISHISIHHIFFIKVAEDNKSIYLLIRTKGL